MSSPRNTSNDSPKGAAADAEKGPVGRPSLSRRTTVERAGAGSVFTALADPSTIGSRKPPSSERGRGGWGWWALLGGALIAATAWSVLRPAAGVDSTATQDAKPRATTMPVAMAPATAPAPVTETSAAAIPPEAVARLESLPADAVRPPRGAAAVPDVAAVAAPRANPAVGKPVAPSRAASLRNATAKARPTPTKTTVARRAAASLPANDPDVEIVELLMSQVDGAPLPRSQQATIASLVDNCRAKPRAEADQCRRNICAGYWGKADVCPARDKRASGAIAAPATSITDASPR